MELAPVHLGLALASGATSAALSNFSERALSDETLRTSGTRARRSPTPLKRVSPPQGHCYPFPVVADALDENFKRWIGIASKDETLNGRCPAGEERTKTATPN